MIHLLPHSGYFRGQILVVMLTFLAQPGDSRAGVQKQNRNISLNHFQILCNNILQLHVLLYVARSPADMNYIETCVGVQKVILVLDPPPFLGLNYALVYLHTHK